MFRPLAQYKIAVTAAASTSLALPEVATILSLGKDPQAIIYAKSADIIYKFSDATGVVADNTATSSKEAAGNILLPAGAIYTVLAGANISAISEDGVTDGKLFVTIGYGDAG